MEFHDISLLLRSHTPILILQTHEETRAVDLLKDIASNMNFPIFKWSVATGMQRIDKELDPQTHLKEPPKVLQHINSAQFEGIYLLLDFHPYLDDPVNVRLLKELAMTISQTPTKLVLVSHKINIPAEVKKMTVNVELSLPDDKQLMEIVAKEALAFTKANKNKRVSTDKKVLDQLIKNM